MDVFSLGNCQVACEEAIATDVTCLGVRGQALWVACVAPLQLNLESKATAQRWS